MLMYFAILAIILMLFYVAFLLGRIYECKGRWRDIEYFIESLHETEKGGVE